MATPYRVWGQTEIFVVDSGGGGGVPVPPAYNVDLVSRGGVILWRQHETVSVAFAAAFTGAATWPTFGARPFKVVVSSIVDTGGGGPVAVEVSSVTPTGCTVTTSDNFTGSITLDILETV